jgi:hypothetical protein
MMIETREHISLRALHTEDDRGSVDLNLMLHFLIDHTSPGLTCYGAPLSSFVSALGYLAEIWLHNKGLLLLRDHSMTDN